MHILEGAKIGTIYKVLDNSLKIINDTATTWSIF